MHKSAKKNTVSKEILPLSKRELEILTLLSDGLSKNKISAHLGISPSTVASHAKNIYHKLRVVNVAGALGVAFRSGILSR